MCGINACLMLIVLSIRRQEGAFTPKNPPSKEDEENENKYRLRDTDKRLKRLTKEKKQSEEKPMSLRALRHKRRTGKYNLLSFGQSNVSYLSVKIKCNYLPIVLFLSEKEDFHFLTSQLWYYGHHFLKIIIMIHI